MNAKELEQWLSLVKEQIRSLHYGVVQIVVHDSKVVQIDRTEKLRLERWGATASSRAGSQQAY
jgi:hypothetical protein